MSVTSDGSTIIPRTLGRDEWSHAASSAGSFSSAGRVWGSSSSRRIRVSEATRPRTVKMAPTRNADEKPSTRASGRIVAVARESSVRDVAIVESAAMPSAPPICFTC